METVYPLDRTARGLKADNLEDKVLKELFLIERELLNTFLKINYLLLKSAF